ncbi:hypothetical protein PCE1_001884 [Barthelona sp. PCE]
MSKPTVLIIRDGWGYNASAEGNAIAAASTPNDDSWNANYPTMLLGASEEYVGLPAGVQGSSEVGHLNAGRGVVEDQELLKIDKSMKSGAFFDVESWKTCMDKFKAGGALHLFGLLQDEGVHAHMLHMFKLMERAHTEHPEGKIVVHPFLDGRDTPPRSTLGYLAILKEHLEKNNAVIGTVMGRYYGMDRSRNWDLTDMAFNTIVTAEAPNGRHSNTPEEAVHFSYENDKTPDGDEMVDEYILPYVIGEYEGIKDGDVVIHTNYRQDRAIQLTRAFVEEDYPGTLARRPEVTYVGFTQYYDEFESFLLGGGNGEEEDSIPETVGKVISDNGLTQLRIAETQKFRHVTSFFNYKSTAPFEGEDQVEVPSRFDAALFASHPEMEAYNLTTTMIDILSKKKYDFILCNYANTDMVGHTGNFEAAKKSAEIVDECLGRLVEFLLTELDANILITADHGNSDEMVDKNGLVKTSHSCSMVKLHWISNNIDGRTFVKEQGVLADIAPTVLHLMGLSIPEEMTCDVLISKE